MPANGATASFSPSNFMMSGLPTHVGTRQGRARADRTLLQGARRQAAVGLQRLPLFCHTVTVGCLSSPPESQEIKLKHVPSYNARQGLNGGCPPVEEAVRVAVRPVGSGEMVPLIRRDCQETRNLVYVLCTPRSPSAWNREPGTQIAVDII